MSARSLTILSLAAALLLSACAARGVDRRYNRFTDETRVILAPMALVATASDTPAADRLTFQATFSSQGLIEVQPPQAITLILQSQAKQWVFGERRDLTFGIDGQVVALGPLGHDGTRRGDAYIEYMWLDVPVPLFRRLAAAQQLRGQLGSHRFELDGENLLRLQEFESRIPKPPAAAGSPPPSEPR